MTFNSIGSKFAAWVGGSILLVIIVLGCVAKLSSPHDATTLAVNGGQIVGFGGGAAKTGLAEIPAAYRVTANAAPDKTITGMQKAADDTARKAKDAQIKKQEAQLKAQQKEIDKLAAKQKALAKK